MSDPAPETSANPADPRSANDVNDGPVATTLGADGAGHLGADEAAQREEDARRLAQFQAAVADARERVRDALYVPATDAERNPIRSITASLPRRPEPPDRPGTGRLDPGLPRGDLFPQRLRVATIAVALVVFALIGRVFSLQVLEHGHYRDRWAQSQVLDVVPAVRGAIVDRNGVPYAISRMSGKSLYAVPRQLDSAGHAALAEWAESTLGLPRDSTLARLERNADKAFLWLKRHLTDEEEAAVAEAVAQVPALGFRREAIRLYPQGTELANVVGFTNVDGEGLEGLELRYDSVLAGEDGRRARLRDALGRRLGNLDLPDQPAVNGGTVVLTIDNVIQAVAEEQLDEVMENWRPASAVALVMNPQTGEILAMASRPGFDPRNRGSSRPEDRRNRAITDAWEPGSIFKPMILAAALQDGAYPVPRNLAAMPDDPLVPLPGEAVIDCENGSWTFRVGRASRTLRDVQAYGRLPLRSVMIKSSNIAMAKVGMRLGHDRLREYLHAFHFGRPLGIDLPGEAQGLLPPRERLPELHTIPSVTMGHSISVTPLQVLSAFNSLVNGGYVLRPFIVREVRGPGGESVQRRPFPEPLSRPLPDGAVREYLRESLVRVTRPGGTARRANLDAFGITVAGKTGTAQKVVDGRYSSENPLCAFLAFAPAEHPTLSVLVIVDGPTRHHENQPFYGGTVAAPPVREILLRSLRQRGAIAGN